MADDYSVTIRTTNINWCPPSCSCTLEKPKDVNKKLPTFWLSSSSSPETIERHRYQIKQQQHENHHQHKPETMSILERFRVDCSQRKIDDVKTLLDNSSSMFFIYVQQQQQLTETRTDFQDDPGTDKNIIINTMIFTNNQINDIDRTTFGHGFWQKHLHNLLLNENHLHHVPNGTFKQFTALQYLNLASNRIVILEYHSFLGLNNLLKLDLGSNRIKSFPSFSISPFILPSLNELNLRQNRIEWIPPKAFNQPTNAELMMKNRTEMLHYENVASQMVNFDLSLNPLIVVDSYAFVQMPRLRKIYLSEIRNQEEFPCLSGTNSVEHIKLDRSRLKYIDVELCKHVGKTLKSLIVKSNQIDRIPPMELCTELRLFDASYNEIKTIRSKTFRSQHKLIDLSLNHNQIEIISTDAFEGLHSLKVLNMENNHIRHIDPKAFLPLTSLRDLNLGHNYFNELPTDGLTNIIEIKVHGNRNLREFPPVESFPYVQTLAMSYAYHCCPYLGRKQVINPDITDVHRTGQIGSTNSNSPDLHDSILWLEDINDSNVNLTITELAQQFWKLYNPHQPAPMPNDDKGQFNYEMFANDLYAALEMPGSYHWSNMIDEQETNSDSNVYFQQNDRQTNVPIKCLPKPDPFMPCKDLFDWWTLRLGVWIVFPLALIGNGTVLVVLVFGRRKRRRSSKLDVPRFLVCNLAAADFFMGIYLGMLAMVDAITLGYFRSYAIRWQNSFICQFTGFTGVFSAELSVYTLAVITLERNYAITHAMHLNKRLSLKAAAIVMSIGWIFALSMAILPLFGVSDYRKVAVCLPFEIDNLLSLVYVLSLIVFNGFAFLLLMACYLRMYCAIRGSQAWNSNDTRIAMRMALLVFTDFLCWAPIAFFTITALAGWHFLTLEEAKIFTIFVLPLNACANPFLYAFFTKQFKKECSNLYKRIETSKLFRSNHRCLGRRPTNTDNMAAILSNCKVCGHQAMPNFFKANIDHHSNVRRIQSLISNSSNEPKPFSDVENNNNNNNNNNNLESNDELDEIECLKKNDHHLDEIQKEPDRRNDHHEECSCQCHQHEPVSLHQMSSANNNKSNKIRMNSTESNVVEKSTHSYTSQLMKHFFSPNKTNKPTSKPHPSKQFKSNSIIYQSNYRKNHIHMTMENEIRSNHNKSTCDSPTENNNNKKRNKSTSSLSSNKLNGQQNVDNVVGQNKSDLEDPHSLMMSVKERDGADLNTVTEYNRSNLNKEDSTDDEQTVPQHYIKHIHPTSAMTTGILMLKNKLIRNNTKHYARKMSSDSQYEFSYYSNRKDSTSTTGRLSFSSENPTKSTSSSFLSSGIWNSSRSAAVSESLNGELILSHDQYQRLIELSCIFTEQMKQSLIENSRKLDYELQNMLDRADPMQTKFILLSLTQREYHEILFEKHLYIHYPSGTTSTDHEKLTCTTKIDENVPSELNEQMNNSMDYFVLYLLDKTNLFMLSNRIAELEVLFLIRKSLDKDLKDQLANVSQCQECIEHYLIEKLMKHLNDDCSYKKQENQNGNHRYHFETLSIHSLIFRCQFRLIKRELDEINEETLTQTNNSLMMMTNNEGSNNRLDDNHNRKKSPISKRMNNSHERIMNFLQTLLPRSNKQNNHSYTGTKYTKKTSSFYRKPRVKKPQSVVTKPIRTGQRRSSSAFALSDEILEQIHQQNIYDKQYYVKSCSQLQVMDSSPSSHKSDSIQEIRSRSAISDVIIRINDGSIQDVVRTDNQQTISTNKIMLPRYQTTSDQEISYNSLNKTKLTVTDPTNQRYHSHEFIT